MTQIDFTSQCAGDLGVTLQDEVVCILFIKMCPETHTIDYVNVYDIRKGGEPMRLPTLAAGVDHMLVTADNYRTQDMEKEIKERIKAKRAQRYPNLDNPSYFASNKKEQEDKRPALYDSPYFASNKEDK